MWLVLSCIVIVEPLVKLAINISMLLPFSSTSLILICVAEACVALFHKRYPANGSPLVDVVFA